MVGVTVESRNRLARMTVVGRNRTRESGLNSFQGWSRGRESESKSDSLLASQLESNTSRRSGRIRKSELSRLSGKVGVGSQSRLPLVIRVKLGSFGRIAVGIGVRCRTRKACVT